MPSQQWQSYGFQFQTHEWGSLWSSLHRKKKKKEKKLLNLDPRTRLGCLLDGCHVFHELGPSISPVLLTYFPHHPESLLVVRTATSNKNGDLVFLQRALVIFNGPDNALRKDKQISFVMHKKYKYINQEE